MPACQLDLAAYLARIGLPAPPSVDMEGLASLQYAHRLAIPFENIDVRLGRGISLDPDRVFDKLVTRRRGGYCFEQNQLFGRALATLGFDARPLLARVWLGASDVPPLTHTLWLVRVRDEEWIADAGFGGSYAPPMPLRDGAEAASPDGARHRLRRDPDHGWMLEREGDPDSTDGRGVGSGFMPQYSFTEARVWPADLALSSHFTSTASGTRFTTLTVTSIVLPRGFASLTDRQYRRRNGQEAITAEITSPVAYRLRLSLVFGIDLTLDEITDLHLFDG